MSYAVIKTGGKQYRVSEGTQLDVEKIELDEGAEAAFDSEDILAVSNGSELRVGTPHVAGASVTAKVVKQFRAPKVTAFKFLRRKGHHKRKGHRQPKTRLEITSISV